MSKNDFAKLLEGTLKGITSELEVFNGRLVSLEERMLTREDGLYLRGELNRLEKCFTTISGRVSKVEEKMSKVEEKMSKVEERMITLDKKVATKQQLKKIDQKLEEFFDALDKDLMQDRKRIRRVEQAVGLRYESAERVQTL